MVKTTLRWLGGGAGAAVPAFAFFKGFPPPLFPEISLITAALATAILLIAAVRNPAGKLAHFTKVELTNRSIVCLGVAVVLLIGYVLLLFLTTVVNPIGKERYQVGFGTVSWTLTPAGQDWLESQPSSTKEQLLAKEGYDQSRVGILWKSWTVLTAGLLLIVAHLGGFIFWSAGFAILSSIDGA